MTEGVFPKVDGDVLYASEVNNIRYSNNLFLAYSLSENALVSHNDVANTVSESFVKLKTITIGANLRANTTIRIKFDMVYSGGTQDNVRGKIYKNGVAVGTERVNGTAAYVTYSEDLAFSGGDTVELWACKEGAAASVNVRNFRIYGDSVNITTVELTGATS